MNPPDRFNITIDQARQTLKQRFPAARSISFVDHGYTNLVALIDDQYAVRFPRTESALVRSHYEELILKELSSVPDIVIPQVLRVSQQPAYVVTSFVAGQHLNWQDINDLPIPLLQDLGRQVARFAYNMHSSLAIPTMMAIRHQLDLGQLYAEPWAAYFERTVLRQQFPTSLQDSMAKDYYQRWLAAKPTCPPVAVHDDLHNHNLLFTGFQLTGVLDFGETDTGSPEQELRHLYRLSDIALQAAVETYNQLASIQLDIQAVRAWAVVQELAAFSNRYFTHDTDSRSFRRACYSLNTWLPAGRWSSV